MGWTKLTTDNAPTTEVIAAVINAKGKSLGTRTGLLTESDGVFYCGSLSGVTHFDLDIYTRDWIISNSISIIREYRTGELTLRALHYRLVGRGMFNTQQHYKRVVKAMEVARWDGLVDFEAFSDLERTMVGQTRADDTNLEDLVEEAQDAIELWMRHYKRNRWENQPVYAEIFIEKKALQKMFEDTAQRNAMGLGAVKGYPSLTFLHEAAQRFIQRKQEGRECIILYFGDYDPSGEDIPRSIEENMQRMGADVEVRRIALFHEQVIKWNLPPAPTKDTDSRTANWDGIGQVELDAVDRKTLQTLAQEAIDNIFDYDLHRELLEEEAEEAVAFRARLKTFVSTL